MQIMNKKIRDNNDKRILEQTFGKKPKHRCPVCHRFSLWVPKKALPGMKVRPGETECVMCEMIRMTKEEEAKNEQGNNPQSENQG